MLNVDNKLGGLSINPTRIRAFIEYIDICKLMDLGFQGPKFTGPTNTQIGIII